MLKTIPKPNLVTKEYRTITQIKGPLIFLERIAEAAYNELVEVIDPDGNLRLGQVLAIDQQHCMVRIFLGTTGLDLGRTRVRFTGDVARLDVSLAMLGRVLNGSGQPIDGGPQIIPEESLDINGSPINPAVRTHPSELIQTGISAIDGLNSLTRGQKLPIFSGAGLPANELAAQITAQARIESGNSRESEPFAVVFAAIGITHREAAFFMDQFRASDAIERTVLFINYADDSTIERLLTACALTAAEFLPPSSPCAGDLTDMTNYCEALRSCGSQRKSPWAAVILDICTPDLASLYERAGRIRDNPGSVTQLVI
jgi:V/A-type H+-transporting ATPase subunit B